MSLNKPKIVLVDYGLANSFKNHIEVNKELLNYPDLYAYILVHELTHFKSSSSFRDVLHDLNIKDVKTVLRIFLFVIKRPKTWIDFLPIQVKKDKIIYNTSIMILYAIAFALLIVLTLLLSKI